MNILLNDYFVVMIDIIDCFDRFLFSLNCARAKCSKDMEKTDEK